MGAFEKDLNTSVQLYLTTSQHSKEAMALKSHNLLLKWSPIPFPQFLTRCLPATTSFEGRNIIMWPLHSMFSCPDPKRCPITDQLHYIRCNGQCWANGKHWTRTELVYLLKSNLTSFRSYCNAMSWKKLSLTDGASNKYPKQHHYDENAVAPIGTNLL